MSVKETLSAGKKRVKSEVEYEPNLSAETLAEITLALSSHDNLAFVLKEILRQAQRLVAYQTAHIVLLEEDNLRIAAWYGYQSFGSEEIISTLLQPLACFPLDTQVVTLREALIVSDTRLEPLWTTQAETSWVRSNLMMPISFGAQVLGLLRLDADIPDAFEGEDIVNLQPLVNMAAIALENARLIDQAQQEINERQRAEEALQQGVEELKRAYKQAIVYAQDLNDEINQHKRVDEERRQLSAAIEQTAESIVITDTQGTILYVNPAFEHITGYRRAEVVGQTPQILQNDQQNPAVYFELWSTIKAGGVWKGRLNNKKKDGSACTLDCTISPVRDKNGVIVNYVQVERDITRELQLEEQYRQAQKMEAIGRLAGGVAHDFNNLLTVINGFTEIIQTQLAPDHPVQEHISTILYSTRNATDLIRQLLAFSRQQVMAPKILSPNTIIANLDKMLGRLMGEDIVLKTHLAPSIWPIKVDPTQVEQVIFNLAVNALDAMPEGGQLTLETAKVLLDEGYSADHLGVQPGEYVLLAVSDTGTGMSEEVQAHIFEPFFTTKEAGKGTGLGLATVFGIVQQHGGYIRVYSELEHGTTFKIYWPRAKEALAATPEQSRHRAADLPRGTETILLVEDEPKVKDLADRLLCRQGYTVLTAANGEEAIQLAKEYSAQIHLLLTDVVMPGINGKALADQFKRIRPQIKTLFSSGYADKAILHQGLLEADVDFIQKPYSMLELSQKVRSVLDR